MNLIDPKTKSAFDFNEPIWQSPLGNLLDIDFKAQFNQELIHNRPPNLWRYREAIPIPLEVELVSLQEGFTPLLDLSFDGIRVGIKQEQLFSTGSYKDRGATVLMTQVKSLGIKKVIQDSSGNAGCAIAAYSALANIDCTIYLQKETSPNKIIQMESYGAHIQYIDGTREDVAAATILAAKFHYYASHSWNPFFMQGTKTFAYEVCEQLGWKAPDAVVLPGGNGTLLLGCYIGFKDLMAAGIIQKLPKLIAVQAANCAPLFVEWNKGKVSIQPNGETTLAEGIAIANPIRLSQMLESVEETKGMVLTVTEEEIAETWRECGKKGFYIEPTSAATIAGLKQYLKNHTTETVISLFSGSGLKSSDKNKKML